MRKIITGLVALIMVLGLLLGGCSSAGDNVLPENTPSNNVPDTPTMPADSTPSNSEPVFDNPPPDDVTWISPGKVNVANFYPGATAEYPVTIHNGNDYAASFSVDYRYPDNVGEGYVKPTLEVQDWVIVADTAPVLAPRETRDILVTLSMPEDTAVFAEQWEFWVSVSDTTQTGNVKTAMATRWLISMRSS